MSHTSRKGEPPNLLPRRRDRCFELSQGWYAMTREGIYIGPYPTRDGADAALNQLIALLEDVDDPKVAEAFVREFARRADRAAAKNGVGTGSSRRCEVRAEITSLDLTANSEHRTG
jgi:Domain of unknown function (DUF6316)